MLRAFTYVLGLILKVYFLFKPKLILLVGKSCVLKKQIVVPKKLKYANGELSLERRIYEESMNNLKLAFKIA